nr:mucin-17-like [Osmia lignaria]
MCEQTEINYLDGDVVWVKLGACWWPGQVTGFHNLPEDIQVEFQKKPLIAAVKFFQEDTYEFVKNYQQIYKYNCTLKDDFIKKGLDKYRSKSKDGSRYMDKFPGDVEMAEKLTGGDPDILSHDKFCPEEKPNISALFGDKKIPKRKREREEISRRSDSIDVVRKITHPRFLKESDHEVRIRQQPSSLPSTPNSSGTPQYPCHLCNFTSSRVNVIICHIKSHRSGGDTPPSKSKVKTYSQYRSRYSDVDTPKRKYPRKEKSQSTKSRSSSESGKRKQSKQNEKAAKKKKTDPQIRDTILADWEDESDEDISLTPDKSADLSSVHNSSTETRFDLDDSKEDSNEKDNTVSDTNELIAESEKLLEETEKLTTINVLEESMTNSSSTNFKSKLDKQLESEKDDKIFDAESNEPIKNSQKDRDVAVDNDNKLNTSDKEDKKALLSCFDFHEEELSIPPVRKKARAFNQKKEIIKEFEMSQALKTEQEKQIENDKIESEDCNSNSKESEKSETQASSEQEKPEESNKAVDNDANKEMNNDIEDTKEKIKSEKVAEDVRKSSTNAGETELDIVEIFEVGKVEVDNANTANDLKNVEVQDSDVKNVSKELTENDELKEQNKSTDHQQTETKDKITVDTNVESVEQKPSKEMEEILPERFTVETEDETVSEPADIPPEQSENSDADMLDQDQVPNSDATNITLSSDQSNATLQVRRRRGRPRKSELLRANSSGNTSGNESPRIREKISAEMFEKFELETRASESDSERSSSGRKRKPNKKYIVSDIYVPDVDQKVYKTDESQSESEDKGYKNVKVKSKRGRKPAEIDKKANENTDLMQEKELEISCNILDTTGNNVDSASTELKDDLAENSASKNQQFVDVDTKLTDTSIPTEISEKMEVSSEEKVLSEKSDISVLLEDTKTKETEDSAVKTQGTSLEVEKITDDKMETESTITQSDLLQENLKDLDTESLGTDQPEVPLEKEVLDPSKIIDMLPPKKSQIKKFELSQIDLFDTDNSDNKISISSGPDDTKEKLEDSNTEVIEASTSLEEGRSLIQKGNLSSEKLEKDTKNEEIVKDTKKVEEKKKVQTKEKSVVISQEVPQTKVKTITKEQESKSEKFDHTFKELTSTISEQQIQNKTPVHTRYKGKCVPEVGTILKKSKGPVPEEKSTNTFQEAFLKTLHMDKRKGSDDDTTEKGKRGKKLSKKKSEENTKIEESNTAGNLSNLSSQDNSQVTLMSNFGGIEVVVDQNLEIGTKVDDIILQNVDDLIPKTLIQTSSGEDNSKSITLDIQKLDESSRMSTSTPSPSSDVTVPVKKREMPRIIENVTLTEPMQILKSKLLDKLPQKGVKHKLETDSTKKGDQKGTPKTKVMKIESLSPSTKMKTSSKITSPNLSLTKKLQVLKAEEAETTTMLEAQNEQLKTLKTSPTATTSEKYIQQSSQSLADMELDINSMPFVLSEDVLTPENIEQMPVVISSIIPASSTVSATLSFTPPTQMVSTAQSQFKLNENAGETSPSKKKSGTPAILKTKNKAKPTITSIKTLVPPLTGGVKGIKFQSTPATSKVPPLLTQKSAPGKYVVVQTSGGQQLRYSVQGKSGTQQKIAIPTGKSTGNAQVVQQGGKVVILTSAQSGQSKMLPLSISKTLSGKVQRIMTNKGQVFCPINTQGIINPSKTIIAPKGDSASPTTSKLPAGHKIINTQGIITSKGVLTPISGTIAKTALLGTLSQGILTKGGVYTPISTSSLGGKAIIGSKTLVTKSGTILSSQNLGTAKTILTPISQAISGRTILSAQGIVSTKGTVLTPITGQQVKAIAAKSPSKSSKIQYQSVQQKMQLPVLQKSQKIPGSSSQGKSGQVKSGSSTVVLQNAVPTQKAVQQGKKIMKQTVVQQGSIQGIASQSSTQQAVGVNPQIQQKGKTVSQSSIQKVIIPRGSRQTKAQQRIVVQKVQEPTITTMQNVHSKQTVSVPLTSVSNISKTTIQPKQATNNTASTKVITKGNVINKNTQLQKNLLNAAMNSVTTTNVNTNLPTPLPLPPLEPVESERKSKLENVLVESIQKEQSKMEKLNVEKGSEMEKIEEPKITSQPQIMALPTESSDGTQTYVLVTIDEQGQIQPLDNNTLMSLEGTTQNPDGTRTLYIDPSSLGEAGTLDNIVLQFDNGVLPNIQTSATETTQAIISETFPTSEVMQTSNQDILAAALANTDFQQEIGLTENTAASVMTTGLTQTSLINQTILQSTIIPPTEPISSASVLETSLTLNQPIMTPLEVPSNLPVQSEPVPTSVASIPSSLELPITITNPNISYITTGEAQIQIPGNSMPDIGEIIENPSTAEISQIEIPASTQYLVLPNLEDNIAIETQTVQSNAVSMPSVSYSVSIPNSIELQTSQVQTTPSMPIIDDTYAENVQFTSTIESSITSEQTFVDVSVSDMLASKPAVSTESIKSQDTTVTSDMMVSHVSSEETIVSTNEPSILSEEQDTTMSLQEVHSFEEVSIKSEEDIVSKNTAVKEDSGSNVKMDNQTEEVSNNDNTVEVEMAEQPDDTMTSNLSIVGDSSLITSESDVKMSSVEHASFDVSDSNEINTNTLQESDSIKKLEQLSFGEQSSSKVHSPVSEEQTATSNEVEVTQEVVESLPAESLNRVDEQSMDVDEAPESKECAASSMKESEDCQRDEPSSQGESDLVQRNLELHFEETNAETSHETPSQSYEQFEIAVTTDSTDLPSQSATKSENSREPSQSITYEPMETDEESIVTEPPSQSFEHSKVNEASQSYETSSAEANINAPTQSFNELMQSQEESTTVDETIDDQTFPTQSYEVGKPDNVPENLETDAEISQEGNMPSQSNDIGTDGIGTSSFSTNNTGLNEDETASSSYVPETPENQERDPDQESAISTSSCEIPPCAELNIASSSAEHTSIHDNGVPEIPTSSYNLNPDITSTHVDSVPTSSYEEQNVSTSYEVPISMPGLEETPSQNFVTESTDHRNEPSSYTHQEVTASYYDSVEQETNSRLDEDPQEEVTPSYYDGNPHEASQSYFTPEEATPSYSSHNVSPSYYGHRPETEASQSYYSASDIEKTEQSSSQNTEASQSFYQEQTDELKLTQQGEATPTYTERYPVDYTLESSPMERHDLVESSVPATRPTER